MFRIAPPRAVAAALGGAILVGVMASSASAVAWGSVTASYDGKSRATGYGDFYNSGSTYAKNKVLTKDLSADGNTVYSATNFLFYGNTSSGGQGWVDNGYASTPEHNHTYYVTNYVSKGLDGDSEKARGDIRVCVQLGFPVSDSCSAHAYPTFGY